MLPFTMGLNTVDASEIRRSPPGMYQILASSGIFVV